MSVSSKQMTIFHPCGRVVVVGLILCFSVTLTTNAQAGCKLGTRAEAKEQFPGFQVETLPKWSWWTLGPVERVYEGGRFIYYQVPTPFRPCNSPKCRGSIPEPAMSMPPLHQSSRVNLMSCGAALHQILLNAGDECQRVVEIRIEWANPSADRPLRPPCSIFAY